MRVFGKVLAVLLLLGLLGFVGYGVWSAGYQEGLVSTAASTGAVVVPAPGVYPGYWGFAGFWGLGLIFRAFFTILIIGFIIRLFFGWGRWRGYGGGPGRGGPWQDHREQMEDRLERWHVEAHRKSWEPSDDA